MQEELFTQALGLTSPWAVESIDFQPEARRIDFTVACDQNQLSCPSCQAQDQPIHDRKAKSWRHLDFFQYEAYIHARVPRVRCSHCGKTTQVSVPWARPGSRFTLLFEALSLTLAKVMPVRNCARQLRVNDKSLWRVIDHHVHKARHREDYSQVCHIGVDETACRRGQHYITLVHDLQQRRLVFATAGRDSATIKRFSDDLQAHHGHPERITQASIDMSKAYVAGIDRHLANASITFDRFHVIQLANKAVDEVRRAEVKYEAVLKKTRWGRLKDNARWSKKQAERVYDLTRTNLKTARAWRLKEALREIFREAGTREEAEQRLRRWYSWARRCRLDPMKKLALTLKAHWQGLLQGFSSHLNNGYVEAMNSLIQAAKARARGYGSIRHFIAICYLLAGKLRHLPESPFEPSAPRMAFR